MAYQHDSDGPVVDKGGLRAAYIAYVAVGALLVFVVSAAIRHAFPDDKRLKIAVDITRIEISHSPYHYAFDTRENSLTVTLWEDGLSGTSLKAFNGEADSVAEWNKTKANVEEYLASIHQNLLIEDVQDVELVVKVVNESNRDRSLLVYKNWELVYDVVRDTKKEGD